MSTAWTLHEIGDYAQKPTETHQEIICQIATSIIEVDAVLDGCDDCLIHLRFVSRIQAKVDTEKTRTWFGMNEEGMKSIGMATDLLVRFGLEGKEFGHKKTVLILDADSID